MKTTKGMRVWERIRDEDEENKGQGWVVGGDVKEESGSMGVLILDGKRQVGGERYWVRRRSVLSRHSTSQTKTGFGYNCGGLRRQT